MKRKDFLKSSAVVMAAPLAIISADNSYGLPMFDKFDAFRKIVDKLVSGRVPTNLIQTIYLNETQYAIFSKMIGHITSKGVGAVKIPNTQLEADCIMYSGYTFYIIKF